MCRFLLNLDRKRTGGWREEDSLEPTAPPSAFSKDIPTHSANGQQVVQPIPVEGGVTSKSGTVSWNRTMSNDSGSVYHHTQSDPHTSMLSRQSDPHTTMLSHQSDPHTTMLSQSTSLFHSIPPQHGANTSLHSQNSYTQTAPSGIHPLHSSHPVDVSYSTVQDMLQSLGCLHHLDSFKKAKISVSVTRSHD